MSKRKSTFIGFLDHNSDLADRYANIVGEDLWSLPAQDIEEAVRELANELKMGFASVLTNCISMSILKNKPLLKTLEELENNSECIQTANNQSLHKYFKEINKIYNDNDNNYDIEFTPENRDAILSMNLKSVIAIAKCYQGLGVDLEDLIGAGNEGLCKAWEKYDPSRARLKTDMINAIKELGEGELQYKDIAMTINKFLQYGNHINKAFEKRFKRGKTYKTDEVIDWINHNISNAKFNSVACKWIKAYIIQEINKNSRIVKKPKSVIDRDKEENGTYKKEVRVDMDAPVSRGDDSYTFGELMAAEDDSIDKDSYENLENYKIFKQNLNILLDGVKSRDRRILLKKFGIGTIRPLQPNEIAIQENLSVARISQIISTTLEEMVKNAKRYNINHAEIFEALSKLV